MSSQSAKSAEIKEEKIENNRDHPVIRLLKNNKLPCEFYNSLAKRLQDGDRSLTLLKKSFDGTNITTYDPKSLTFREVVAKYYLKNYNPVKKCVKTIQLIYPVPEDYFAKIFRHEYATVLWFVVVGCPRSSDIDVMVIVDAKSHSNGKTFPLTSEDHELIRSKLTSIGYDSKREIDINVIALKEKKIVACFKGGKETANIVIHTAKLHKQVEFPQSGIKYDSQSRPTNIADLIEEVPITEDMIYGRIQAILKFILEYLEIISINYLDLRPEKMDSMATGNDLKMLEFVQKIMTKKSVNLDVTNISDKKKQYEVRSFYKSLVMKFLQLYLLIQKEKCYFTKDEIASSCSEIFTETEKKEETESYIKRSRYYLFRGSCNWAPQEEDTDLTFLNKLLIKFYGVTQSFIQKRNPHKIVSIACDQILEKSQDEKSQSLPKDLLSLFFKSIATPTIEFKEFWKIYSKGRTVNQCFPLPSSKREDFLSWINIKVKNSTLSGLLDNSIEFCDQRSDEWLKLLSEFYKCGNNGGVIKGDFESFYNLIRGAILEKLAIDCFDPEAIGLKGYKKWSVGFVVEEKIKGSRGFAPDLLVMGIDSSGKMELITIEIKGLKSFECRSDYDRGLNLASKQVTSAREILSKKISQDDLIISRGIVLICSIKDGSFVMNHHFVDF